MIYIIELRNRCFLLFICWSTTFIIGFFYKEILLFEILNPCLNRNVLYSNSFIFTNISELFDTYFDLIWFFSVQLTIIYLFYSIMSYLIPALYTFEYNSLKSFLKLSFILWLISIFILINYLIPSLWNFFFDFQTNLKGYSIVIHFEAKVSEYVKFFTKVYFGCNLYIQSLAFLILFFRYFFINKELVKSYRNIFYLGFLIMATGLTPPDVFSQFIVFIGLTLFFETSIVLIFLLQTREIC